MKIRLNRCASFDGKEIYATGQVVEVPREHLPQEVAERWVNGGIAERADDADASGTPAAQGDSAEANATATRRNK